LIETIINSKKKKKKVGPGLQISEDSQNFAIEDLREQLLEIWKRLLENEDITVDDYFQKFPANKKSLERKATALMVFIKNVYGVDFSAEVLNSFSTVTLLAEKVWWLHLFFLFLFFFFFFFFFFVV